MLLPQPLPKILFVTGTDTDCGKTTFTSQLLNELSCNGVSSVALKPLVSGGLEDIEALQAAASIKLTLEEMNAYRFPEPIAPHIGAAWHKQTIELKKLVQQVKHAQRLKPDIIVIEGAGGWLVPLNDTDFFADYVQAINAEVCLVVGIKLGCINHSLLTVRALASDNIKLHSWVANIFDPNMSALKENIETLSSRIDAPGIIFSQSSCHA